MKKIIAISLLIVSIIGCGQQNKTRYYKVYVVRGIDTTVAKQRLDKGHINGQIITCSFKHNLKEIIIDTL